VQFPLGQRPEQTEAKGGAQAARTFFGSMRRHALQTDSVQPPAGRSDCGRPGSRRLWRSLYRHAAAAARVAIILAAAVSAAAPAGAKAQIGADGRTAEQEQKKIVEARRFLFALQEVLADIVAEAEPSVVSVIRTRRDAGSLSDASSRPVPMDQLAIPVPPVPIDRSFLDPCHPNYVPTDFGSGVVIDSDGLILTNYHVVEGGKQICVRFQDGSCHLAELWAADPRSDLAVLHVPGVKLKPIRMGDADKLRKGHFVIALGNPYATAQDGRATAAWGIVANVARRPPPMPEFGLSTLHHSGTLIQTDIRLNYGISGGALLNLDGEMVGLITSLAALQAFEQAAGYAIPMNDTILTIVGVLRQGREVEYGFLGVQPVDVKPSQARRFGLARPEGAMINYCYEGTPAYRAGLRPGDVIVAVDGKPVRNRDDLILLVGTRLAGSTVTLDVIQGGRRRHVPIKLGKYPISSEVPPPRFRPSPRRGLRVDYITMLLRDPTNRARLSQFPDGGVLITEVLPNSPAQAAQLRPGIVITHVNGKLVSDPDEFYKAMDQAKGDVKLTTEMGLVTVHEK